MFCFFCFVWVVFEFLLLDEFLLLVSEFCIQFLINNSLGVLVWDLVQVDVILLGKLCMLKIMVDVEYEEVMWWLDDMEDEFEDFNDFGKLDFDDGDLSLDLDIFNVCRGLFIFVWRFMVKFIEKLLFRKLQYFK